jgi:hypothetical protein
VLLDTFKEFTLVPLVEVFNTLFELDLSGAERVDLHKLLQVEEGFRDGKLVGAAGTCEERFEFGAGRKLKNHLINFAERFRINELIVFTVEDRLHKESANLLHIAVLKHCLRVNPLDFNWQVLLERIHYQKSTLNN